MHTLQHGLHIRISFPAMPAVEDEDNQMGDLGSDPTDQLDRNMWAPEEKDTTEVITYVIIFFLCYVAS